LTAAAAGGDSGAAAQLTPILDQFAQTPDWAALAAVLRRIAGGERGDRLLDGPDPVDTAIASKALTRLARRLPYDLNSLPDSQTTRTSRARTGNRAADTS